MNALLEIRFKPYAMTDDKSQGRIEAEKTVEDDFRTQFQHDRDRIIHSKAFRRLESKTQVVTSQESDHNRKRLTHSLEVLQMADSIAYALGVNIFLTQAIALGHDLGHAPFGHGGEKTLNEILMDHGLSGFKHNYQSLLIVNKIETRYRDNGGLNLMYETRDGILRHTKIKEGIPIGYYDEVLDSKRQYPLTLEGQIVRIVDEIAQRTHDTDDGLRTGRIELRMLLDQDIMKKIIKLVHLDTNSLIENFKTETGKTISKIVVAMIKCYVLEVVRTALNNIDKHKISDYNNVRDKDNLIVSFSPEFEKLDNNFQEDFLRPNFYNHYEIKRMDSRGNYFIKQLFKAFKRNPGQLPQKVFTSFQQAVKDDLNARTLSFARDCAKEGCLYSTKHKYISEEQGDKCPVQHEAKCACEGIRVLINYIAGMTDRHANLEYSRLYLPPEVARI
jgi:dGTPase